MQGDDDSAGGRLSEVTGIISNVLLVVAICWSFIINTVFNIGRMSFKTTQPPSYAMPVTQTIKSVEHYR